MPIVPKNPTATTAASIVATTPTVATKYQFIVGVDTHANQHVYSIITNLGESVCSGTFRVLPRDFERFLLFIHKRIGTSSLLFSIEGTSSYGETLTKFLMDNKLDVCEVKPIKTKLRGGKGKTDLIDAEQAARAVLHLPIDKLILPRTGDTRKSIRTLLSSRNNLVKQQTTEKNFLTALVRSTDLGIDARTSLCPQTVRELSNSRAKSSDAPHKAIVRTEAKRLGKSILERDRLLSENAKQLTHQISMLAPSLLEPTGIGPVCAAIILCAYSHKGRIKSTTAFTALAGVSPIPASSGNTTRHRLNHSGDRTLNSAFDTIAKIRMQKHEETKLFVAKRIAKGSSPRDIRRILKCYIARSTFRRLEKLNLGVD